MGRATALLAAALAAAGMSCRTPASAPPASAAAEVRSPSAKGPATGAPVDPRAILLGRWLKLDEAQTAKLAEIYREDAEDRKRRREERRARIRRLLTEEQRRSFDGLLRKLDPTPEERRERFVTGVLGLLRRGLDLTGEQEGRIRPVLEKACGRLVDRMERLRDRAGKGVDWSRELRETVLYLGLVGARVRQELDREQRKKFDRFVRNSLGRLLRHLPRSRDRK